MGNRKEPIETEGSGIPNHHALQNRQSSTLQLLRRLAVRRLALRWRRIHADRIVEERVYEGEFDDVKTDAGEREVPFDKRGLTKSALIGRWNASKHRQPDDLVFCTRKGGALERRNLLRHIKIAATKLGLAKAVGFRSFRTMHSSLMLREDARPEVVRDR
jgi:site-specific recombinase XerC